MPNGSPEEAGQYAELSARIARLTGEVAMLRQRLDTVTTFERFRDAVLTHRGSVPYQPPSSNLLDARDFMETVEGVYFLEYGPTGAYRWTGPGNFTRFSFFVDRRVPVQVELHLMFLGRLAASDILSVDIEGVVYPFFRAGPGDGFVAGPVPPRAGVAPTDVVLHVPVVFAPGEGSGDTRRLGVAISSIALEPAP